MGHALRTLSAWAALAAILAALGSCGDDKATNEPTETPALRGSYRGSYYYTAYQGGVQSKVLTQNVTVAFDDTLFVMRVVPGELRVICDLSAKYSVQRDVAIDCPDLQYDCPEWEHPCGVFTRLWKGDSLKLTMDTTYGSAFRNVKRLALKKLE